MSQRLRAQTHTKWKQSDWERGWEVARMRINKAPLIVICTQSYQDALKMLDEGFAMDSPFKFGQGLLLLMECCREAIQRGDCKQWW